ncbi:hypothetical protein HELRODRAFT_177776 [Helobdella robusta]|uniref:Uncharacterized protein n=1 Tax=Helobdella robusta TaxID=6412 RepID=T1FC87_HELRO|nr:hypothetical protein HELRODRAFT_177776 [Helobdella robusta]ESN97717.1 hypothetical protein HELRODRAFT_177776 [Helobdella robusta]
MTFANRWVLRSALNFVSDGEIVRKRNREFQRKAPEKANADLAKGCLIRVKKKWSLNINMLVSEYAWFTFCCHQIFVHYVRSETRRPKISRMVNAQNTIRSTEGRVNINDNQLNKQNTNQCILDVYSFQTEYPSSSYTQLTAIIGAYYQFLFISLHTKRNIEKYAMLIQRKIFTKHVLENLAQPAHIPNQCTTSILTDRQPLFTSTVHQTTEPSWTHEKLYLSAEARKSIHCSSSCARKHRRKLNHDSNLPSITVELKATGSYILLFPFLLINIQLNISW